MNQRTVKRDNSGAVKHGVSRAINKAGYASRSRCEELVRNGMVRVNGKVVLDPEFPTTPQCHIEVEGQPLRAAAKVYLMLNKPRGLVTTASDEKGRATIYSCLPKHYAHLGVVGRLDMASEGLLLLTNDTEWADRLLDPRTHVPKTYHVQVGLPKPNSTAFATLFGGSPTGSYTAEQLDHLCLFFTHNGPAEFLAQSCTVVRSGGKTAWLQIVLHQGKNRQIRRLAEAYGIEVLRLIRVSIGSLQLGDLGKGEVREITSPSAW